MQDTYALLTQCVGWEWDAADDAVGAPYACSAREQVLVAGHRVLPVGCFDFIRRVVLIPKEDPGLAPAPTLAISTVFGPSVAVPLSVVALPNGQSMWVSAQQGNDLLSPCCYLRVDTAFDTTLVLYGAVVGNTAERRAMSASTMADGSTMTVPRVDTDLPPGTPHGELFACENGLLLDAANAAATFGSLRWREEDIGTEMAVSGNTHTQITEAVCLCMRHGAFGAYAHGTYTLPIGRLSTRRFEDHVLAFRAFV
jgi:hypothetical protein